MIVPLQSNEQLLVDIRQSNGADDGVRLWWLGQSGFLVQWNKQHLLFDPYLSDSLTIKYATTDKPHDRMTELVVDPGKLDFIDVVTSSHNHTDHLDGETLIPLMQANPDITMIVPAANQAFAADRLQVEPDRLTLIAADDSIIVGDFKINAIPAAHEIVERDEQGRCRFIGLVVEFGNWTVYHSGDTMMYDGMVERLKKWDIDIALLPINGRVLERRVAGNLWGREAARLATDVGAKTVIPCHYDMFEFNTESPDEFVAECERLKQSHRVLECGERFSLPAK